MFQNRSIVNPIRKVNDIYFYGLKLLHNLYREHAHVIPIILYLVLILCLAFPICAEAGRVYGRIYGVKAELQPGDPLIFKDVKGNKYPTQVNKYKGYSIILPEGIYRVEFQKLGTRWSGSIRSFPDTVRQDIYLKKQDRR